MANTLKLETKSVIVWKNGRTTESCDLNIACLAAKYRRDPNVLFLIDGPPGYALDPHRYVVFTSASEE